MRPALLPLLLLVACGARERRPEPAAASSARPVPPAEAAAAAAAAPTGAATAALPEPLPLGCRDVGIYPDLDDQVVLALPPGLEPARASLLEDPARKLVTLYHDGWPVKAYPLPLREADAAELAPFLAARAPARLDAGAAPPPGDRDGDGLADPLDVLAGAHKLLANRAEYTGAYFRIGYPGGDPPRDRGSCVDVVIRSFRNAGVDLQQLIAEDIARAPKAYPMVKKPDSNIDHRRVRTMLPFFVRHMQAHGVDPHDAADPFRPGDVLFMDTLPGRAGPDHVGIVSDRSGASGLPLVINNWTDGTVDAEMDLLEWVPVTHRFRLPPE